MVFLMLLLQFNYQMDVSPVPAKMVQHAPLTQTLETSPVHTHQAILVSVVSSLVGCSQILFILIIISNRSLLL